MNQEVEETGRKGVVISHLEHLILRDITGVFSHKAEPPASIIRQFSHQRRTEVYILGLLLPLGLTLQVPPPLQTLLQ